MHSTHAASLLSLLYSCTVQVKIFSEVEKKSPILIPPPRILKLRTTAIVPRDQGLCFGVTLDELIFTPRQEAWQVVATVISSAVCLHTTVSLVI